MTLPRALDPLIGRSFGEFVLRERIGEGGFGAVYRASQPALDREAVVKVLHARFHASAAATERFLREARLASKLDHPYAAHIYAFGAEADGELWIAMELVRGTPLDKILKIQGSLALERFLPLLDRICEVVHTAHEQGIVHRDLKPANVMVIARAGRLLPKLLDFGIAKGLVSDASGSTGDAPTDPRLLGDAVPNAATAPATLEPTGVAGADTVALTQRGTIMGSPAYMAPEQWVDAGDVDARTDLYALGALAYECLTGRTPFVGTTFTELAYAHANEEVPPLGSAFPTALDGVFTKVLAKRADDRYPDALAFAGAFREASGIGREVNAALPVLDADRRDAALASAPQPIADAVGALDAARTPFHARNAIIAFSRTIARYVGLLALACRSRISAADEPTAVGELLRALHRRTISDHEWLQLGRASTQPWLARRDAHPLPELVDALHTPAVFEELDALAGVRDREATSDDELLALIQESVARINHVLGALAFLADYPLVVPTDGTMAERWMGARRGQRTTVAVRGRGLEPGMAALLDSDGTPVLSLAPLFQLAAPSPGAPSELFLFDGRDARGAKLVAQPSGFEHHDEQLWDWFRLQFAASLEERDREVAQGKPPYRGLRAFSADDADAFVGREKQVDAFLNRLKSVPLLAVVGRSGAGKSSFVQAGVVPALPEGWRAITLRPGASPLTALVARLEHARFGVRRGVTGAEGERVRLSSSPAIYDLRAAIVADRGALGAFLRAEAVRGGPIVLVVEQLEEMFTLCRDPDEGRAFAEAIAAAALAAEDPVRVIFTLRDDFLVRTEQIPALRNRIGQGLQLLTVPAAEDPKRILVEPARRAGYEFEGELASDMVAEVADQPGALALLSFTATKLWELRDRHFKQLTYAAFKTLGGVGGALAKHADVTLDAMPPEERMLAREAFRHLVTSQNTRAVLARTDLHQLLGGAEPAERVIERLVASRLLVAFENEAGDEVIEIVHEALLVTWPRLIEWRREDADGARFREQLRAAAAQWHERGRARGLLWRDDALADYSRWRARHVGPLTEIEAAFASSSLADAARGRRNLRILIGAGFAILGLGVIGLVVANARISGQEARAQAAVGELHGNLQQQYEDQGRRLVIGGEPLQGLAYLVKAHEEGATGPAHDFLVAEALRATDGELNEVTQGGEISTVRYAHSGTRFVTAGADHAARVWDTRTGEQLLAVSHTSEVRDAAFSPDDTQLLTAGADGMAAVWDATTGRQIYSEHHNGAVMCARYSPDGKLIATSAADGGVSITELATRRTPLRISGTPWFGTNACDFSPDGKWFAGANYKGVTRLWSSITGAVEHTLHDAAADVDSLAFSPDGTHLAIATRRSEAVVWDVVHEQVIARLPHEASVVSTKYSPDGRSIVTASHDRTAAIWDAETGVRRRTLRDHAAAVTSAAFTVDGRYVVTTSEDASARLWDVADGRLLARWYGHRDVIRSLALDPRGDALATAGLDGTAFLWKLEPQDRTTWMARLPTRVINAEFSPDGRSVVASTWGAVLVWDVGTGRERFVLHGHADVSVGSATFSHDGATIATGGAEGAVKLWDASTGGARRILVPNGAPIAAVSWSADDTLVAVAGEDGALRAWEPSTGELRFQTRAGAAIYSLASFPHDDRFITTSDDLTTRIFDGRGNVIATHAGRDILTSAELDSSGTRVLSAATRQTATIWNLSDEHTVELHGHVGEIRYATWSHDGQFVVTASTDGTARIWDAIRGDMLAIINHPAPVGMARFSPDDKMLLVIDDFGGVAIHAVAPHVPWDQLTRVIACRVPYTIDGNALMPRVSDRHSCLNQP